MTLRSKPVIVDEIDQRWNWLFKLGGTAALSLLALFLIGITRIATAASPPNPTLDWFTSLQNNWLMALFSLNFELSGAQTNLLNVANLVDIVIMVLFGVLFLALYTALSHSSKIWAAVATSLPFLGIPVFLITQTAGRSALLIGGLIFSIIMLRSGIFTRGCAYVGIVASVLLFFGGDIGTTIFTGSKIIAIFIGVGYVMWMIWFFLVGQRLFQLGHGKSPAA